MSWVADHEVEDRICAVGTAEMGPGCPPVVPVPRGRESNVHSAQTCGCLCELSAPSTVTGQPLQTQSLSRSLCSCPRLGGDWRILKARDSAAFA